MAHGYNMFHYPLYVTDEGIYIQQAWSVLREARLSPYTYFYDHAPAGWLLSPAWVAVLPSQFQTFGSAIDTGRALMLVVHCRQHVPALRRDRAALGQPAGAPSWRPFFFNVSPLAIFYQRQVLLDNLMVFWMLLALYLLTRADRRVVTADVAPGIAFGLALLTKENAHLLRSGRRLPAVHGARPRPHNRRFGLASGRSRCLGTVSLYFLYASSRTSSSLPASASTSAIRRPTTCRCSTRSGGSCTATRAGSSNPRQPLLAVLARRLAAEGHVDPGRRRDRDGRHQSASDLRGRRRESGTLVAGLLAASYAFYLARGA